MWPIIEAASTADRSAPLLRILTRGSAITAVQVANLTSVITVMEGDVGQVAAVVAPPEVPLHVPVDADVGDPVLVALPRLGIAQARQVCTSSCHAADADARQDAATADAVDENAALAEPLIEAPLPA